MSDQASSIGSLPKYLRWQDLGQAETQSQELHLVLPSGWQGLQDQGSWTLPRRVCTNRRLAGKSRWMLGFYPSWSNTTWGNSRWQLNLLHCNICSRISIVKFIFNTCCIPYSVRTVDLATLCFMEINVSVNICFRTLLTYGQKQYLPVRLNSLPCLVTSSVTSQILSWPTSTIQKQFCCLSRRTSQGLLVCHTLFCKWSTLSPS